MRSYNLNIESNQLLKSNIINLITSIHEYKGKQSLYIESNADILTSLLNIAKV